MRRSNALRRALLALGCAFGIYAALLAGFAGLSRWAEVHAHAHPFDPGGEVLRILLPSIVGLPGRNRIMLLGSSSAQEALLYEKFEATFPGVDAYQVAFGMATLDDTLVALEYVRRVYGDEALPDTLVVALETRSLANLPRAFGPGRGNLVGEGEWERVPEIPLLVGDSLLFGAINAYSPYFFVIASDAGSELVPKGRVDGARARWGFLVQKQQRRYRMAVAALLNRLINGPGPNVELTAALPELLNVRAPLGEGVIVPFARWVASDPTTALRSWLAAYVAPYVHRYRPHVDYDMGPGGEGGIAFWDPEAETERGLVVGQLRRLRELADEHGVRLFVVLVPEHPDLTRSLQPARREALRRLVREALGDTPFLDFRTRFGRESFVDDVHVRVPAAEEVTAAIIEAIRAAGGPGG